MAGANCCRGLMKNTLEFVQLNSSGHFDKLGGTADSYIRPNANLLLR